VRTDARTALPNRLGFQDSIDLEFARMNRSGEGFALICVDLDNFKLINDKLGHAAGDELLVQAARRMSACVRPNDLVARIGGDEFVILITSIHSKEEAIAAARRVSACFEAAFYLDEQAVYSAACLGLAVAPQDGTDPRALLRNADIALYRAKQHGGTLCLFEARHDAQERETRALEADLRRALALRQFALVFQPILDIGSGEIVRCEALLRWIHPTRGHVDLSVFIPLAEKAGLIEDIGLWAFENACKMAARLPARLRMAINVSPMQLRAPHFFVKAMDYASAFGVSSTRLEIEITESVLLADDETTDKAIRRFSQAGIGISLDDFGAGYSSLSYLRRLPLNRIKIDRMFMRDVLIQPDCAAIVIAVIRMAADLPKSIVAEGVEDEAQLEWLRHAGCSEAQGYLISAPRPEQELIEIIENWKASRLAA
jgi:diguanylate cyclase (GGDEF)-like protein